LAARKDKGRWIIPAEHGDMSMAVNYQHAAT
jgi:hypothetical protein